MRNYSPDAIALIQSGFGSDIFAQGQLDVQQTPLYDTVATAAAGTLSGAGATSFFTNIGGSSGKTFANTNMTQPNRLPSPQAFAIYGMRVWWSSDVLLADLVSVLNNLAMTFTLGNSGPTGKYYQLAPLWHFCAGGGIFGYSTRSDESVYVNGQPGRDHMHKLLLPIAIENGLDFAAYLQGTSVVLTSTANGGTGMTLVVLFDGFYARGVQ